MSKLFRFGGFVIIAATLGVAAPAGAQSPSEDEATLRQAGVDLSDAALVAFLRGGQKTSPAETPKIQKLIDQLADGNASARQQAAADLEKLGSKAAPLLEEAVKKTHDSGFARRARKTLRRLGSEPDSVIVSAVVRTLVHRRAPQALAALLAYLPRAGDDEVVQELRRGLATLAMRDGAMDAELVKALADPVPVRRATAAEALCQTAGVRALATVHPLLQDRDAGVRLRVALALAERSDADAIPVLIELVAAAAEADQADSFLRQLAADDAPKELPGRDPSEREKCRRAWADWWSHVDGRALVETVRRSVPDDAARERVRGLIVQLGDDDFAVRESASAELLTGGAVAVSLLRLAVRDPDPEIAHRAEECLKTLSKHPGNVIPRSAVRLIALRKPPGAAEALLAYLPFADSDEAVNSIHSALAVLAAADPQAAAALERTLTDKNPLRRGSAGAALCRTASEPPPAARRLLADSDPTVRLAVALALTERHDKSGLPVLIALLDELPANQLWRAEELLRLIAGREAPEASLSDDKEAMAKCRDAWQEWWTKHAAVVDLARVDETPRLLGYTLIVQFDGRRGGGQVYEIGGRDNKQRWRIEGLGLPLDAQVLPGNRVLIAEYQGMRVTERNFKGDVLWEKSVSMPINVQRMPNGSTFIATQQELLEVDRSGKETVVERPPGLMFMAARKLRDGGYACITQNGTYVRLDAKGKEQKSFPVGQASFAVFDVLPNGHVLVPQYVQHKVTEYDGDGKIVWEAKVSMPGAVHRLPNGHTLVASQSTQTVLELDHSGNTVWQYRGDGRIWQVKRR